MCFSEGSSSEGLVTYLLYYAMIFKASLNSTQTSGPTITLLTMMQTRKRVYIQDKEGEVASSTEALLAVDSWNVKTNQGRRDFHCKGNVKTPLQNIAMQREFC